MAGRATGNLAVGLIYPSIADWAASRGKLEADDEYNRVMSSLPELRDVVSARLFTAR